MPILPSVYSALKALMVLVALSACAHPTYSLRVPKRDASFPLLVAAASRTLDEVTGEVAREHIERRRAKLYSSKGVEELSVRLEENGAGTQLSVFVDRPELYPPGIAEAFWRTFTRRLDEGLEQWSTVERGESQAALSAPAVSRPRVAHPVKVRRLKSKRDRKKRSRRKPRL